MTKKDRLINWMKLKKVFATHEVVEIGLKMYNVAADRTKRKLMEGGFICKLSRSEYSSYGYNKDAKEDVYRWAEEVPQDCFL